MQLEDDKGTAYGQARVREEELQAIRTAVGNDAADNIGNLRFLQHAATTVAGDVWDWVLHPALKGLEYFNHQVSRLRGPLAGKYDFSPTSAEEITGLKSESGEELSNKLSQEWLHGPWYEQAFQFLTHAPTMAQVAPNATINLGVDLVTDPLIAGSGAVSLGKKVYESAAALKSTAAIDTMKATHEAKVAQETARQAQEAKKVSPSTNADGSPVAPPDPGPDPLTKVRQDEAEALQAQIEADHEAYRKSFGAEGKLPLESVPTPIYDAVEGPQLVLKGFGRYVRKSKGEAEPVGVEATRIPDRKQMKLLFEQTAESEDIIKKAASYIDSTRTTDPQTLAGARKLLDEGVVNRFSIGGKERAHGFQLTEAQRKEFESYPDQVFIVASAAVERAATEKYAKRVAEYLKHPGDAEREGMLVARAEAVRLTGALSRDATSRGSMLRAESARQAPEVQALEAIIKDAPAGASFDREAWLFSRLTNPEQQSAFLRQMNQTGQAVKRNLLTVYLNSLLSTTGGLAVGVSNFAAGATLFGVRTLERAAVSRFSDSGPVVGEASARMWGFVKSYQDLLTAEYKTRMAGASVTDLTSRQGRVMNEFETRMQKVAEKWTGTDPYAKRAISERVVEKDQTWYTRAVDFAGMGMKIPGAVVGTVDAILGFAMKTAEMEAHALRDATKFVEWEASQGRIANKADIAKVINIKKEELLSKPDSLVVRHGKPTTLNEIGENEALLNTMMKDLPQGSVGGALYSKVEDSLAFRAFVPFFKPMYTTASESVARSPVFAAFTPRLYNRLKAGGEEAATAKAELATGVGLAAITTGFVASKILVPDGPTDPQARAMYKKAYGEPGIHLPGREVIPFTKLGVLGNILASQAQMAYMIPRLADHKNEQETLATAMASVFTALTSEGRMNADLADLTAMLASRDSAGIERWIAELPARTIPKPVSQVAQQLSKETRIADNWYDRILIQIPGMKAGTVFVDELGVPTEVPDWHSWNGMSKAVGMKLNKEWPQEWQDTYKYLLDKQVTVTGPARIQGEGIPLSLDAWMETRKQFGAGKFMSDLKKLVDNPTFRNDSRMTDGPHGSRQALVTQLEAAYHKEAVAALRKIRTEEGNLKYETDVQQLDLAAAYKHGKASDIEIRRRK